MQNNVKFSPVFQKLSTLQLHRTPITYPSPHIQPVCQMCLWNCSCTTI